MLPEGLEREFWQELRAYEEERRMPYITSVEEIGFERGLQQEARSLIFKQLTRKLGVIPTDMRSQIETLSVEQLEALGEALLDFAAIADLTTWLQAYH
jgi:predicted DNA-binding ribbon-helix-helix protein